MPSSTEPNEPHETPHNEHVEDASSNRWEGVPILVETSGFSQGISEREHMAAEPDLAKPNTHYTRGTHSPTQQMNHTVFQPFQQPVRASRAAFVAMSSICDTK